jgi:hypothetical protein
VSRRSSSNIVALAFAGDNVVQVLPVHALHRANINPGAFEGFRDAEGNEKSKQILLVSKTILCPVVCLLCLIQERLLTVELLDRAPGEVPASDPTRKPKKPRPLG